VPGARPGGVLAAANKGRERRTILNLQKAIELGERESSVRSETKKLVRASAFPIIVCASANSPCAGLHEPPRAQRVSADTTSGPREGRAGEPPDRVGPDIAGTAGDEDGHTSLACRPRTHQPLRTAASMTYSIVDRSQGALVTRQCRYVRRQPWSRPSFGRDNYVLLSRTQIGSYDPCQSKQTTVRSSRSSPDR
jgi:hypothetical protein